MSDFSKCHEAVYRNGGAEPCDKQAVAMRRDPEEGQPYPVCYRHARSSSLMVPLPDLLSDAERRGAVKALRNLPDHLKPYMSLVAQVDHRADDIEKGAEL